MQRLAYPEADLVTNRVSVLLFGGSQTERLAWANEAAQRLAGDATATAHIPLPEELCAALLRKDGVLYVPDVTALDDAGQRRLVQCLLGQEERPKLVLGFARAAEHALAQGTLRPELHYRLRSSQVDLEVPGLRAVQVKRRARLAVDLKRTAPRAAAPVRPAPKRPTPTRAPSRASSARPPAKRSSRGRTISRRSRG